MTEERLAEIKARADKATSGQWLYTGGKFGEARITSYRDGVELTEEIYSEYDAQFIANARQDVPELVAEVERLKRGRNITRLQIRQLFAEIARLRKALEFYATVGNYAIETAECWEGTLIIEDSIANDDGGEIAREALQNE